MPRFVYPANFDKQLALFKSIKKKHDDDGTASALIPFLSSGNINMVNDNTDADAAAAYNSSFKQHGRNAEALREERDVTIKLPRRHIMMCAQFLKALFADNPRRLGDWAIEVNNKNKLVYPRKFAQRVKMMKDFIAKHNSFAPGTSPLEIFLAENDINLANDLAAIISALDLHDRFLTTSRNKEMVCEQRNVLWKPVMKNVKGIGSYVKSLYKGKEHKAGAYGFTVDSSRRKPRLRRSVLLSGKSVTIKGAALGSVFTNHGKEALHLYKSKKKSGKPLIIASNQDIKLPKGYSALTVFNPSEAEKGIFSTFRHK